MPPDLVLLSTLNGSNYCCLELNFMVPKVFEPLKFDCRYITYVYTGLYFPGVLQQVDQALEKEEEERRKNLLKKEQKNINEEIK